MDTTLAQENEEKSNLLQEYSITDILEEPDFENICRLASQICHTPSSLTGIIDAQRQTIKVHNGIITYGTKDIFDFACNELLVVPDLAEDEKFRYNSLVINAPHFVFFTGIPLVDAAGRAVGTLCAWDIQPCQLIPQQIQSLQSVARMVMAQFDQSRKIYQLNQKIETLQGANDDLDNFAAIAAHDLKGPLNAIISFSYLLKCNYGDKLDDAGNEFISFLEGSANNLAELVTGILKYSRSSQILTEQKEDISFTDLIEEVTELLEIPGNVSINYEMNEKQIRTSRIALKQVLLNLISNAIRHNDKSLINVEIALLEDTGFYSIKVKDNGPGINEQATQNIFDLFKTLQENIKNRNGSSIGLAIVKRLVDKLGGTIKVESELTVGTTFTVTLPK